MSAPVTFPTNVMAPITPELKPVIIILRIVFNFHLKVITTTNVPQKSSTGQSIGFLIISVKLSFSKCFQKLTSL